MRLVSSENRDRSMTQGIVLISLDSGRLLHYTEVCSKQVAAELTAKTAFFGSFPRCVDQHGKLPQITKSRTEI